MMDDSIRFTVRGTPVGKGRAKHRHVVTKSGREFNQEYTPAKTRNYEQIVRLEYERQGGKTFEREAALAMAVRIVKPIPKSASKTKRELMLRGLIRPTKKPDVSNVLKAIEDGLNGVAYHDDSQIVDQHGIAYYGEEPCVEVEIWAVNSGG